MTSTEQAAGNWAPILVHVPALQGMVTVGRELTMTIDGDTIAGHSGVNRFRGTAALDGSSLSFGPLMTTRMAGDPSAMELEHAVLAALDGTVAYRRLGDLLCLEDADGRVVLVARTAAGG